MNLQARQTYSNNYFENFTKSTFSKLFIFWEIISRGSYSSEAIFQGFHGLNVTRVCKNKTLCKFITTEVQVYSLIEFYQIF